MRESLKNVLSNSITLEDGSQFYYTVKPYELTNAIGKIIAVLQEYNFTKKDDNNPQLSLKLYKTKEGNWYDVEGNKTASEKDVIRMLKSSFDFNELNLCINKQESK